MSVTCVGGISQHRRPGETLADIETHIRRARQELAAYDTIAKEPCSTRELAARLGLSVLQAKRLITDLVEVDGVVHRNGHWHLQEMPR